MVTSTHHPKKKKSFFGGYLLRVLYSVLSLASFKFAVQAAILPAVAAAVLYQTDASHDYLKEILLADAVYMNLRGLIVLAVVFHAVQSYARFMTGLTLVYQLAGELHEAAAMLATFAIHSKAETDAKQAFLDTLARLFSMLYAVCLGELEDDSRDDDAKRAFSYGLIDPQGLDDYTLHLIEASPDRPICVYQRLLDLIMISFGNGVISVPPPLFTRCFQELSSGMSKFHECLKFKDAPFPVPFMIITDTLLMVYTLYTPFVMASWSSGWASASVFTFLAVWCVWLLHCVAEELDNPFGHDSGDLKTALLTADLNRRLLSLLDRTTGIAPHPSETAAKNLGRAKTDSTLLRSQTQSLNDTRRHIRAKRSGAKVDSQVAAQDSHNSLAAALSRAKDSTNKDSSNRETIEGGSGDSGKELEGEERGSDPATQGGGAQTAIQVSVQEDPLPSSSTEPRAEPGALAPGRQSSDRSDRQRELDIQKTIVSPEPMRPESPPTSTFAGESTTNASVLRPNASALSPDTMPAEYTV